MSKPRGVRSLHDRIIGLTAFLDAFESPEFTFGEMSRAPGKLPCFKGSEIAAQFVEQVYELGWVLDDFDWMSWDEGNRFIEDPKALDRADIADIERLLTAHVRNDRFCEGHLGAMFDSGHLTAILRQLRSIGQEVED